MRQARDEIGAVILVTIYNGIATGPQLNCINFMISGRYTEELAFCFAIFCPD
jgi:hypothetical protein